jgi:succinate dehydrogenase / fumarate reductase iron-sulfur subunit
MRIVLHVWRQAGPRAEGRFERYEVPDANEHMSFLEMLDVLNQRLIGRGEEPIAFDSDCREGICGTCGFMIDGVAHGPRRATTVCQLHMREFSDGAELRLEPWRSAAFPVVRDLVVDRSAFDRIVQAGGYISVNTGNAQDANCIPVPKPNAERAFEAAACIGCGACVAQCPNGAAQLFTSAKVSHLALLPQGQPERLLRVERMVDRMEGEGFGTCSNFRECEAVCPKQVSIDFIAWMNRDWSKAKRARRKDAPPSF